jgi:hypothetical protein
MRLPRTRISGGVVRYRNTDWRLKAPEEFPQQQHFLHELCRGCVPGEIG